MKKTASRKKAASRSKAKSRPATIDEYLAQVPEPARGTLGKVRTIILSAAPRETVETISYGIPAFKYRGSTLAWFAAFADHCSFFPTGSVIAMFRNELRAFPLSKGTVRFPIDKPLPATLVKKMVKARLAQVQKAK